MRKKHAIVILAFLLPVLIASSKFSSQPAEKTIVSDNLNLALDPINYTIGVSPNEEYTWIITSFRENNLKLLFGSNWTDTFGISGIPQLGHKFKANVTSNKNFLLFNNIIHL